MVRYVQPAKRFTERMVYRSVRTLVWKSFELVSPAQCSWSGAGHMIHGWFPNSLACPTGKARQGFLRVRKSEATGRWIGWIRGVEEQSVLPFWTSRTGGMRISRKQATAVPVRLLLLRVQAEERPTQKHCNLQWARQVVPGARKPLEKRRAVT